MVEIVYDSGFDVNRTALVVSSSDVAAGDFAVVCNVCSPEGKISNVVVVAASVDNTLVRFV